MKKEESERSRIIAITHINQIKLINDARANEKGIGAAQGVYEGEPINNLE